MNKQAQLEVILKGADSAADTEKQANQAAEVVARLHFGLSPEGAALAVKAARGKIRWDGGRTVDPNLAAVSPQDAFKDMTRPVELPYGQVVPAPETDLIGWEGPALWNRIKALQGEHFLSGVDRNIARGSRNRIALGGAGAGLLGAALYTALSKPKVDEEGEKKRKPWLRNLFLGAAVPAAIPYAVNWAKHSPYANAAKDFAKTKVQDVRNWWNSKAGAEGAGESLLHDFFDAIYTDVEAAPVEKRAEIVFEVFDAMEKQSAENSRSAPGRSTLELTARAETARKNNKQAMTPAQLGMAGLGAATGTALAHFGDSGYDEHGRKRKKPYLRNALVGAGLGAVAPSVVNVLSPVTPSSAGGD